MFIHADRTRPILVLLVALTSVGPVRAQAAPEGEVRPRFQLPRAVSDNRPPAPVMRKASVTFKKPRGEEMDPLDPPGITLVTATTTVEPATNPHLRARSLPRSEI
jgi:hypothetical protein